MTIWANTIVNNEENFIWFSIMSVIDFVDQVIVYDTGSTDKTVEIIREIQKVKKNKIQLEEVGIITDEEFPRLRQRMLEQSKCDWILVLDGDEIWWDDSVKKLTSEINKNGNKIDGIVVPMVVPVGDIYHIQEERAGRYSIKGKTGHISLKAFSKKIPNLHVTLPYGKEGFFDNNGKLIQEREDIVFVNAPLLHVTHLKRSSKKRRFEKFKYELGNKVDEGFKFPEVFFRNIPALVSTPWVAIKGRDRIIAKLLNPIRSIKRKL